MSVVSNKNGNNGSDAALAKTQAFEARHVDGASAKAIVEHFETIGDPISEPTFRKYVQLGLLPRSVRVGQSQGRGSHGLYPTGTATRVLWIRRWMAEGYTMDEIQHGFLMLHDEVETLEQLGSKVLAAMQRHPAFTATDASLKTSFEAATRLHGEWIAALRSIEKRLSLRARMARAVL